MRLRNRAVILLAIANAAVFGVLGAIVLEDARRSANRERETNLGVVKEFTPALGTLLDEALRSGDPAKPGELLESVLSWPHWGMMGDAIFLDTRNVEVGQGGARVATGLCVNPLGIVHRRADFDLSEVISKVNRAIEKKAVQEDLQGVAVPVISHGIAIGGAYFLFRAPLTREWSPAGLLITFFASTVLLTTLVGYLITHSVVRPVEEMANVSLRIARGDLAAAPAVPDSGDEMEELAKSMAAMLKTLRDHRLELERACDEAARRAQTAERELLSAQRLASMGTLAAGIAHEINNPLGGLMNAVAMLRDAKIPEDRREEYYELVLDGLQRIQGIVGRVLTMAPRPIATIPILLSLPASDAVALLEHRARKESLELELRIEGEPPLVLGDRGELVQVFLNLLINAFDAIADRAAADAEFAASGRGRVRVIVRTQGSEAVASVSDNGVGIPPENRDRVFDPFFTTKEPGRGSGLGLAVVYGIVRSHHGSVSIAPDPDLRPRGCEVTLRFPLQAPENG